MGYRDVLLQRMRESGLWQNLTVKQRSEFYDFSDERARRALLMDDAIMIGDRDALREAGRLALDQIGELFGGALLADGALTPAGLALGRFFAELLRAGVAQVDIENDLHELNVFVQAALFALYESP